MKKQLLKSTVVLATAALGLVACSNNSNEGTDPTPSNDGKQEVLEFYHGYFHNEDEWPVAKVMRDLYDDFAKQHEDGPVQFKPTPVSGSLVDIMNNKVASGQFPDMIDLAGNAVSLAAIEQDLVLDLKPYIDENNLQKNVGLNYTQNLVDGKLFTVHDQMFTMGLWYNKDIFEATGAKTPEEWNDWSAFSSAMEQVRTDKGIYAFGAGEPAIRLLNTALAETEEGRKLLEQPLTEEGIKSVAFTNALTTVMTAVNQNGAQNSGGSADTYSADFVQNKSAVFFNGVWAAGGVVENPAIAPGLYPGHVAISSCGGGMTISSSMSKEKQELALEFLKYMTSDEVQKVIFEKVGANPANENINVAELAEHSDDPTVKLLGTAIAQVKNADYAVKTINDAWGGDVRSTLINALSESAASSDVNQKVQETQDTLIALIN
ncbi:carbohydrate ABC transporter substrate-binding protein, CUT1 family [Granulicatella balaenopterae]|uniref:Carbohydrate ABC transporter substrate-binding protein, CUT1 family n=1 Tax=Granulicatella balaenopterae TaxID=137733 RepID=A0A1H9J0G9_9LACT|nr:extracellular solute-binding protein [Granulicatella balaenopterae]SEQ80354.1 carbohydrate ABC transporter substrate-binding protein, CUT1 family [Granulicatella balaenopterae]